MLKHSSTWNGRSMTKSKRNSDPRTLILTNIILLERQWVNQYKNNYSKTQIVNFIFYENNDKAVESSSMIITFSRMSLKKRISLQFLDNQKSLEGSISNI